MSDDQNKPTGENSKGNEESKDSAAKLPGPLPGLGGKAGGAAPLPGLSGAKPGAAPLPGLGGPKPGAAPLPGLGGAAKPVVPPFMQQAEPEKPAGPSPEALARDPFGAENLPAQRPSFIPPDSGFGSDKGPAFSESEAGRSRKPLLLGGSLLVVICLFVGYLGGNATSGRVALNIAIRDARIIDYELKKSSKLFEEVEGMINSALLDAQKRKYHKNHLTFLSDNVEGNPVNPRIFTDRNYKNFDVAAVQWLNQYFNKWGELYGMIEKHRRQTKNDAKALEATGEEFKKLLTTQYGAVFGRNDKAGGQLTADLVVVGACEEEKGAMMCQVQVDTGTFGDQRELYSPEGENSDLTKEPGKYVMAIGENSKAGLLKNSTQSHFMKYAERLKAMSDQMKGMREIMQNLRNKISEISSQEPVSFGGFDVEEEVNNYITNDKNNAAGAEAPPAE